MTNSNYDISHILERGNELIVKVRMFEGSYGTETDEDGNTIERFFREKLLFENEVVFNFYRVTETEMHDALKAILADASKLPIIKEQA